MVPDVVLADARDRELAEAREPTAQDDREAREDVLWGVEVAAVHPEEPYAAGKVRR